MEMIFYGLNSFAICKTMIVEAIPAALIDSILAGAVRDCASP